jgi:hypothetical protein
MIHVDLPYDFGTFVKVKDEESNLIRYGSVAIYEVMDDGYLIWVSGYKEPWRGVYLPDMVELMSDDEIEVLVKKYEAMFE